ncbi:MAG: cation:proton antiporter [Bdellovibrionota bacterium]
MSPALLTSIAVFLAFTMIAVSANQVGKYGIRFGFPLISGLILAGVLAGPHIFSFIDYDEVEYLKFVDLVALPFIAFTAGAEIHLSELKKKFKSIVMIIISIVIIVMLVGTATFYFLADQIPFMVDKDQATIFGIALLGGCILIAKSPSSLVAIIKELRAKGTYIQTALGATVLMDAVVIVLFATVVSFSDMLFAGSDFDLIHIVVLFAEVFASIATGVLIAGILRIILSISTGFEIKATLVVALCYSLRRFCCLIIFISQLLPIRLLAEPLLICIVAGFCVTNFTKHSAEFENLLEKTFYSCIYPILYRSWNYS